MRPDPVEQLHLWEHPHVVDLAIAGWDLMALVDRITADHLPRRTGPPSPLPTVAREASPGEQLRAPADLPNAGYDALGPGLQCRQCDYDHERGEEKAAGPAQERAQDLQDLTSAPQSDRGWALALFEIDTTAFSRS